MDTVGTMEMSDSLHDYGMQTCLHKFYEVDDLVDYFTLHPRLNTFYTLGIKEEEVDKLLEVDDELPDIEEEGLGIHKICIDVANGYQKVFVDHVKRIRDVSRVCNYGWKRVYARDGKRTTNQWWGRHS